MMLGFPNLKGTLEIIVSSLVVHGVFEIGEPIVDLKFWLDSKEDC